MLKSLSAGKNPIRRDHNVGRVFVHNPNSNETRLIPKMDLQRFLDKGWLKGRA